MKKQHIILGLLLITLLAVGGLFASGFLNFGSPQEVARPGCEWMSTEADVDAALSKHQELTEEIESLGEGITVSKTVACQGEKALVTITYQQREDYSKISDALDAEGYEASVEVIYQ